MSDAYKLQEVLTRRNELHGVEVQTRFTEKALKAISPSCLHLAFYSGDLTGEKYNKATLADGSPNPLWQGDPPRDPEERKKFFLDLQRAQYESWIARLEAGEFDGNPTEEPEPKPEPSKPVEVVKTEPVTKPEQEDECMETCNGEPCPNGKECDIDGEKTKPTPKKPIPPRNHIEQKLLGALSDFIASTDTPPEDQADPFVAIVKLGKVVAEQQKTIDKQSEAIKKMHEAIKGMAQKVPEMIKEEILKKFS